jgi:soluble lytic murein transglycosylase-like protein
MKITKWILIICIIVASMVCCKTYERKPVLSEREKVLKVIVDTAKKENVETALCITFAKIESDFRPDVFNSHDPSHGLYQLAFDTARSYNPTVKSVKDLYDVQTNTNAGIRFIKYLMVRYPKATAGQIAQLYNLGETKYNRGIRNKAYKDKFLYWYKLYQENPTLATNS